MATHVLFLLDEYSRNKGGVYSMERGIIKLLKNYQQQSNQQIQFSSLTCKTSNNLDPNNPDGISLIHPVTDASLDDIVNHDMEFYTGEFEERVRTVTHIVLFASKTLGCALDGGLVDRVTKCNNSVKVIVINNEELEKSELFSEVKGYPWYFSLAEECYNHSNNLIKHTKEVGGKSVIYYPYFEKLRNLEMQAPDLLNHLTIVTFISAKDDDAFLDVCHRTLKLVSSTKCDNDSLDKSSGKITWKIFHTDKDKINDLYENSDMLEIICINLTEITIKDVKVALATAVLSISPGNFTEDVYSGLELLLSGIPVVVLSGTDTNQIVTTIDPSKGEFFKLPNWPENGPYDETISEWKNKIIRLLIKGEIRKNFGIAKDFAEQYQKHTYVRNSIKSLIEQFIQGDLSEEHLSVILDGKIQPHVYRPVRDSTDTMFSLESPTPLVRNTYDPSWTDTYLKQPVGVITEGYLQTDSPDMSQMQALANSKLMQKHSDVQRYLENNPGVDYQSLQLPEQMEQLIIPSPSPTSPVFINDNIWAGMMSPASVNVQHLHGACLRQAAPYFDNHSGGARPKAQRLKNSEATDSEASDSDDSSTSLPRVPTPPQKTKSRKHGSSSSSSSFLTSRAPKSAFSKKIAKVKRDSEKPVKKSKTKSITD